jgi:tetratricopeptide (TPR) repeat protein
MKPELWQRLKPLFHEAMGLAVEDRPAFIRQACGDDDELKQNLEQLVQAANEETQALGSPPPQVFSAYRPRFTAGQVLLERFRIVRPIGRGGMGEVYEAEDLQLGRVALKTMGQSIASSSQEFGRFRQEVQLARKVSGPEVCRIHELYLLPGGEGHAATAFLTMEYLDGVTLTERLKKGGRLPPKEALRIALDICEGLRLVHAQGVIHRDLKSSNIMLCGEGASLRAVLMDFGLARDSSAVHQSAHKPGGEGSYAGTIPGAIMGTPAYMAPEQFEAKPVSPATDIYALGIVLYELVTGLHPYAAPTPVATAARRAHHPALPSSLNRAIPRKWDRVIQCCLQYEPCDRFQSADEVARELRAGPANLKNLRLDRPWVFRVACALIMAALVWGVFAFWQRLTIYKPGPEALQEYNDGLSLIRQGNYAEATRVLQEALKSEQNYVMAHARLSEAWYNLDFQGSAQQELLIALPGRNRLSPLDRMYLDAIQETVTGDASAALETRRRILDRLAPAQQSSGYVDLGMAYERAGDIPHALESYSRAAQLDSKNPAAYMHTGILQSRLHHVKEGEEAFNRAESIFEEEIDSHGGKGNPEGLAEVDYERGYAATGRRDSKDAEQLLARSLDEATKVPSIQLEIRALTQLSSAESASYDFVPAVNHAEQAIQLADENRLESWKATGLVRLASVQVVQGHLDKANPPLKEAMRILQNSPQPRVQALANFTLASLMDQEHLPDKVVEPAQAALEFYKKNGFFSSAFSAALLLVRVERNQGQYKQALASGSDLLSVAAQSGIPALKAQAEELVGSIYLAIEQYPDALLHFQNAMTFANSDKLRSNEALQCANALWRLGRYPESEAMLRLASGNDAILANIGEVRVESLLSQQKFAPALLLARRVISDHPDMVADRKLDLEQDEALAEAHLGMKEQAMAGLSAYITSNQPGDGPMDSAQQKLIAAEIYLWVGMKQQALDAARASHEYFASAGLHDSELRSSCLVAAASKGLKDDADFSVFSKKVVDIQSGLGLTWGPDTFHLYISRPDMHELTQRNAKGPQ